MLNDFSQTKAAIIIETLIPFIDKTCKDRNGYIKFLRNLSSAAILFYGQNEQLDNGYKSYIIFSFTNSSYFLWNNFNSDMEDQVYNQCMFPINIFENEMTKDELNNYFQTDISNLFITKNEGNGLRIAYSNSLVDFPNLKIPDLTNSFKNDFSNHLRLIHSKPRIISKNEYREFLVYICTDLFQDYQNKAQFLPDTVMTQVYEQVENVAFEIFKHAYENISPEAEIYLNRGTDNLFTVKDKYLYYLHRKT